MEAQGSAAELIRVRIGELVAKGDFHAAMVQSEELEILTALTPFGEKDEHWAKVHLALLLLIDDVNNGRHLWRRLPTSAKGEGGELAALWAVGKCLWKRDMKGAQDALRGREWTPAISPFASLLREHVRERQLTVLSKAFTSLTLERVASMLDCDIDGAMEECAKEGWAVEGIEGSKIVKPTPRASTETIPATTPDYLQKMARHIAFLERRNLG